MKKELACRIVWTEHPGQRQQHDEPFTAAEFDDPVPTLSVEGFTEEQKDLIAKTVITDEWLPRLIEVINREDCDPWEVYGFCEVLVEEGELNEDDEPEELLVGHQSDITLLALEILYGENYREGLKITEPVSGQRHTRYSYSG